MNVLTYGEIMDGGASVFHCVVREDAGSLFVTFSGVVRVDNPSSFDILLDSAKSWADQDFYALLQRDGREACLL